MKNNKLYILLFCILPFLSACEDGGPYSGIDIEDFYKTEKDIATAIIGCYNGLQNPMLYEWQLTELRSDNAKLRSTNSNTSVSRNFYALDQSFVDAAHPEVDKYWRATYANINRCNLVLKPNHISVVWDNTLRQQYKGEACFLRAYHYFNLVRLYGPVFLVTTPISQQEAMKYSREPEATIYAQIEKDLRLAIDSLPANYNTHPENIGKATAVAAKALLAKVYLTEKKYADAEALLYDIVTNRATYGYDMISDYPSVFSTSNEMNKEILFAVRYRAGGYGLGSPFPNYFAPGNSGDNVVNGDGSDYNIPTEMLKSCYIKNDSVRAKTCFALGYNNPSLITPANPTGWVKERSFCKKYLSPVIIKNDGENDWPVLRFADVYLMYAEALNENPASNVADVITYLNKTKIRAGLRADKGELVEAPQTRQQLRNLILAERRLELAFENQRWFDLLRSGRTVEIMNEHYAEETRDGRSDYYYVGLEYAEMKPEALVLPIPQKEININPMISQNPGY